VRALFVAAAIGVLVQQPTFRSRVELIRLDVSVMDADGRPVRDLRADDFIVTVDGAPRRVTFAQFYGPDDTPRPVSSGPPTPLSVATNSALSPGRVVVLVADLESIKAGYEKPILDTAASLVDRLGPADAVGLLAIHGPSVEVTRDHARVRDGLGQLRGLASAPLSPYRMSVREAEAFRSRDRRVISQVVERECRPSDGECPRELSEMAMPLLLEADRRTQSLVPALTALFARLGQIEAPRSIVLLSAGLQRTQGSTGFFNDLQRRAESAGISMTIVQVEQPEIDASHRSAAGGGPSRADLNDGLSAIAGATGAQLYYGIGRATGAFDRIRNEIVHTYQLGVEGAASDGDGRKHRLGVNVKRRGLTVRAQKELVVNAEPDATLNPRDVLSQPVDFAETPLIVSTYMTRGQEPAKLKVIVLLELPAGVPAGSSGAYAFSIAGAGTPAFETADRLPEGSSSTAVAVQLAPGSYRLRAAVVGADGRPGSLEMPILVGLRQAGSLQFSDLILGATRETFTATTRVAAGTPLSGLLELYSGDAAQLDDLTVAADARRAGDQSAPLTSAAEVKRTDLDRRRIATFQIPPAGLVPGTWIVSAVVRRAETVVGRVSRTIVIEAARDPGRVR
jgi:VWFA-related protein